MIQVWLMLIAGVLLIACTVFWMEVRTDIGPRPSWQSIVDIILLLVWFTLVVGAVIHIARTS